MKTLLERLKADKESLEHYKATFPSSYGELIKELNNEYYWTELKITYFIDIALHLRFNGKTLGLDKCHRFFEESKLEEA